jgi:hypothetical protein
MGYLSQALNNFKSQLDARLRFEQFNGIDRDIQQFGDF